MINRQLDPSYKAYERDIRKTRPVSREEERELFKLCRAGDRAARDKLVKSNMRFVLKVAIRYPGCPVPLPDRISYGVTGLMRAIDDFDHSRGLKFISYAVWWVKAHINKAINEHGSLIRLPDSQRLRVRKAIMSARYGEEIPGDIREMIQIGGTGTSFDAQVGGDEGVTMADVIQDENAVAPCAGVEDAEAVRDVALLLSYLPEREALVLRKMYGVGLDAPRTLREVGVEMGVSFERVRQIQAKALNKLRRRLGAQSRRGKVAA